MTDYASLRLGGLTSPVTSSTTNTALQDADPALYWFTQWMTGIIQTHLGPRWDAEVARTAVNRADLVGKIVQATIPYDPVPLWQEAQFELPLLAIYRTESQFSDRTVTWIHRCATVELDYIFPPLTPGQLEALWPIASAIEAVIYDRINQDGDPNVLSGQRLKDLMLTEYITVLNSRPSRGWLKTNTQQAPGTANTVLFPLLHMRFEIAERTMPVTYPSWTGADGNISTSNGTTSVDIADFSKNNP